jgi:predicted house-cleaning noncanonical NTP pyrophosphatase (MazG superfamily)
MIIPAERAALLPQILRFRVEKLIRDKLPEIMRAAGLSVFDRRLDEEAFVAALKDKLIEETAEAVAADSAEDLLGELADVMEVVLALGAVHGFSAADVEARRLAKRAERGGFETRVWNAAVEGAEDCPAVDYYLARPERYPRV